MPKAPTINRAALRRVIAKQSGITQDRADDAIEAVINGINASLLAGQSVKLVGFGKFAVSTAAARRLANPVSGEMMLPARRKVRFTLTAATKRALNEHGSQARMESE